MSGSSNQTFFQINDPHYRWKRTHRLSLLFGRVIIFYGFMWSHNDTCVATACPLSKDGS